MKKLILSFIGFFFLGNLSAQLVNEIKGSLIDANSKLPIAGASISVQHTKLLTQTDSKGQFSLSLLPRGDHLLVIKHKEYESRVFPFTIEDGELIDLDIIILSVYIPPHADGEGMIVLTEQEINDDNGQSENIAGLLQSSRDLFQNRAAFDWGAVFFKVRGYNTQHASVLINGVPMNKLFSGRPEWNNWGGINDATRSQELTMGLAASNYTFGGLLGTVNINTKASLFRSGLRVSSSYSNRTYAGRGMVTYNSGLQKNGLAYSFSASRRWGNEGYIDGTLYDAFGFFGSLEARINNTNSVHLTGIYTPNRRGQVAPISDRVFKELGRSYNPYWGFQEGVLRNSRVREIAEPLFIIGHVYENENTSLSTNIAYQTGKQGRSRLDYNNAPNPNPNYWRYLSNISKKPQVDWNQLYNANTNTLNISRGGEARYLLVEDTTADKVLTLSSILNTKLTPNFVMDLGGTFKKLKSENFASPLDLLGAQYYNDSNPFALINNKPARNDLLGEINKGVGDRIKYNYRINASLLTAFAQLQFSYKKADFFLSGTYSNTNYQREGYFLNQNFEDNSLGKSEPLLFTDLGIKAGLTYKVTGRHLIIFSAAGFSKAPPIRNSFINVRENNKLVSNLTSQNILAAESSYLYRSPTLKTRFTTYFTEFKQGVDLNFIFAQGGSGTDFFQEVITQIDTRHLGIELGIEYQASPTVKAFAAVAYGQHTYTNNPQVSINFDTAGFNDDLINTAGFKDLGAAYIKDLRIANGPQRAYTLGISYNDPKFWWLSATTNYLSNAYADVSTITRTNDFFINPKDPFEQPFEDIDLDLARRLLRQEVFDGVYLLNLTGGKSWRYKGHYISLFISINNVFDEIYKTGGFEQSRTANYADLVADTTNDNGQRNFGNKHWYGPGRSYFINLSLSL